VRLVEGLHGQEHRVEQRLPQFRETLPDNSRGGYAVGRLISTAIGDRESDAEWLERCRRDDNRWSSDNRGRACEVRNVPVRPSGRALAIDGERNGGIRVFGWDGDSVRVTARMQAEGRSDSDAQDRLSRVRIVADGRSVRAEGPSTDGDHAGW